ncbi:MAG: hypothetical protein ACRET4_04770, partial [Steroidobacteraceae bacterium]
ELLPLLRHEQPTVLCMLPAALFRLVRDHGAGHEDFRSLRLCRSGSDKVPAELEREFTDLTGLVIDGRTAARNHRRTTGIAGPAGRRPSATGTQPRGGGKLGHHLDAAECLSHLESPRE